MEPHLPTMFLMTIVVAVTMAVSVAAGASRGRRDGNFLWACALGFYALSYTLFSLRGQISNFISIVIANGIFSAIFALFAAALLQFQQRKVRHWLIWLPVPITLITFANFQGNFPARIILNGLITIIQIVFLLVVLYQGRASTVGRGQYFVATGFMLLVMLYLLRITLTASGSVNMVWVGGPNHLQTFTYIIAIVLLPVFGVGFLIMTKERTEEENRQLATHDQLTGLANRRSMGEILNKEWSRSRRGSRSLAVAMVDVDLFKKYNDRYGHLAGDDCLKEVARILQAGLKRSSDLAARYGGEEFLLIFPETDITTAQRLTDALRQALVARALPHDKSPLGYVTLSAGVAATMQGSYDSADGLLQAADDALYEAKQNGRNQIRLAASTSSTKAGQAETSAA